MAEGVEVDIRTMEQVVMACIGLLKEVHGLQVENERLKAENERRKREIADLQRRVQLMEMENKVMRNDLKLAQEKRDDLSALQVCAECCLQSD